MCYESGGSGTQKQYNCKCEKNKVWLPGGFGRLILIQSTPFSTQHSTSRSTWITLKIHKFPVLWLGLTIGDDWENMEKKEGGHWNYFLAPPHDVCLCVITLFLNYVAYLLLQLYFPYNNSRLWGNYFQGNALTCLELEPSSLAKAFSYDPNYSKSVFC